MKGTPALSLLAASMLAAAAAQPLGAAARPSPAQIVAVSSLGEYPAPAPAVHPIPVGNLLPSGPLFSRELWNSLQPPNEETLRALAQRVPDIDPAKIREVPEGVAGRLLDSAVARKLSALEFFTDGGLLGDRRFYISGSAIQNIDKHYFIRSLFPLNIGAQKEGGPWIMEHLLLGNQRVEMLYDAKENFTFHHPLYKRYRFKFQNRVALRIDPKTPAHAFVENVEVIILGKDLQIRELLKRDKFDSDCEDAARRENAEGLNCVEVVTRLGNDLSALFPITRRAMADRALPQESAASEDRWGAAEAGQLAP